MGDFVDAWPRISERLKRDRAAKKQVPAVLDPLIDRIKAANFAGMELVQVGDRIGFNLKGVREAPLNELSFVERLEIASYVDRGRIKKTTCRETSFTWYEVLS